MAAFILLANGDKLPVRGWTDGADDLKAQLVGVAESVEVTGALTAAAGAGSTVTADVAGMASAAITLSGTYAGLVMFFEGSIDEGTTWFGIPALVVSSGTVISFTVPTNNSSNLYWINCAGLTDIRVRTSGYTSGSGAVAIQAAAIQAPYLNGAQVDTELAGAAALSDTAANPTTPTVGAAGLLWDGTQWIRERTNLEGTALASGARTSTTTSTDITNHNARGVVLWLVVSAVTATPLLQVNAQGKDPVTGNYTKLAADPTAIGATGTYGYEIYPGATTAGVAGSGNVNARTSAVLPKTFRVVVTHGDADSATYSVGYSLIR